MSNNPVVKGPVANLMSYQDEAKLDTSFRILLDYHIGTDSRVARIDILKSGAQFNVGFHVRPTRNEALGSIGGPNSQLVMPKNYDGCAVQVNSGDLIAALRGLADRLEQQIKDDAEKNKP